jgi:hypothetical protein
LLLWALEALYNSTQKSSLIAFLLLVSKSPSNHNDKMHASLFLSAIALAPLASAVPYGFRLPSSLHIRQDSGCDLSSAEQPENTLTAPAEGTSLLIVAMGRGTQNYTCGADATLAPTAIGAVADLFDISCNIANTESLDGAEATDSIGKHYFFDNTTPDFDIPSMGNTRVKKVEDVNAPVPTEDVKWLKLDAQADGTTSDVKSIYRLNTVGGLAPANCEGKAEGEVVTVEYEAQYWMYG